MLSLFKDLFIADGFNRSLLVDMTRGKYHLISKRWSQVISLLDNRVTGKEVETYLAERKSSPFGELYSFLTKHEMIFEVDKELIDCFTPVRMENETPSLLDSLFIFLSPQNIRSLSVLFQSNRNELESVYIYRFFVEDRIILDHLETFENIVKNISLTSMIIINLNKNLREKLKNSLVGDEKIGRIIFDEFDGPVEQDFYLQKTYLSKFPVFNIGMS